MPIGEHGIGVIPRSQQEHIKLNLGNVLMVGILAIIFDGAARWTSAWLSRTEVPVLSQLAVGAQYYYKAA